MGRSYSGVTAPRRAGTHSGNPSTVRIITPTVQTIARFALRDFAKREELMREFQGWWRANGMSTSRADTQKALELAKKDPMDLSGEEIGFLCSAKEIFLAYHIACEAL